MHLVQIFVSESQTEKVLFVLVKLSNNTMGLFSLKGGKVNYCWRHKNAANSEHLTGFGFILLFFKLFLQRLVLTTSMFFIESFQSKLYFSLVLPQLSGSRLYHLLGCHIIKEVASGNHLLPILRLNFLL
jgi:hypothetical protein